MNRDERRFLEEFRRNEATSIENNLIDEIVSGEIDRSEFLRRGAMFGLSITAMSSALGLAGEAVAAPSAQLVARKKGGIVRVGVAKWGGSLEPYKLAEAGSLAVAAIPGEFLTLTDNKLRLRPLLAKSWKANGDATVWTFQLRKGVKFHNGQEMTADDVVANFKLYTGDKQSQALSNFKGVLSPDGVVKKGRYTVQFHLEAPTGAFPYLVSEAAYQTIIVPRSIPKDDWVQRGMISTGPYKLHGSSDKREYNFVRHPAYWGGVPALDGVKVTTYETSTAQALALRAGQLDIVGAISTLEAQPFLHDKRFQILHQNGPAHREFTMRVDNPALKDPRVRRAVALTLNRPEIIAGLLGGGGTVGNDTPFWKGYPSSDRSVQQRKQKTSLAKALLAAAGQQNLSFTITTHRLQEIPDYAAAIQRYGREAGMNIGIELQSDAEYYGGGADYQNTTPWLNKPATITEWGARPVPNVYLTAAFASDGIWNAPHYKNPQLDSAITSYLAAVDIKTQRKYSKQISGILLRDTPTVIAYHFSAIFPTNAKIRGYQPAGLSHVLLQHTHFV
ncbi:MAG: ABC transporter substrate-binding protein [Gaiellaceae bacterium]